MSVRMQTRLGNKYSFDEVGICCLYFLPQSYNISIVFLLVSCFASSSCFSTGPTQWGLVPVPPEVLTILFWMLLPPVASKSPLFFLLYCQLSLPTSDVLTFTATLKGCGMCRVCIVLPFANSSTEELPPLPSLVSHTAIVTAGHKR